MLCSNNFAGRSFNFNSFARETELEIKIVFNYQQFDDILLCKVQKSRKGQKLKNSMFVIHFGHFISFFQIFVQTFRRNWCNFQNFVSSKFLFFTRRIELFCRIEPQFFCDTNKLIFLKYIPKILRTQTPKIFEIPFLREHDFIGKTKTNFFVPSIACDSDCLSIMRHFYQIKDLWKTSDKWFLLSAYWFSRRKRLFKTCTLPLSSI